MLASLVGEKAPGGPVAAFLRQDAIVRRVLAGEEVDAGRDVDRPLLAAVLWQDGGPGLPDLEALAATLAAGDDTLTLPAGPATLWAWFARRDGLDALAAAAEAAARLDQGVALGTPGNGLAGFRRSHAEAMEARRVAGLAGLTAGVVRYDAVEAVSLMTEDLERAGRFVRRTLGGLAASGDSAARMRRTLRAWLAAGGSAPAAAGPLGVHKNTVLYRVHRAEALLPRPVEADRLAVELALAVVETVGLETLEHAAPGTGPASGGH